jgi:hypothetical protein
MPVMDFAPWAGALLRLRSSRGQPVGLGLTSLHVRAGVAQSAATAPRTWDALLRRIGCACACPVTAVLKREQIYEQLPQVERGVAGLRATLSGVRSDAGHNGLVLDPEDSLELSPHFVGSTAPPAGRYSRLPGSSPPRG